MLKDETPVLPGLEQIVKPFRFPAQPYEYKVTPLRECPTPEQMQLCDTPDQAAAYWRMHIATNPYYDPERETFAVILLNTRKKVKGHQIVSIGTHDTILVHPISVFRLAVMVAAPAKTVSFAARLHVGVGLQLPLVNFKRLAEFGREHLASLLARAFRQFRQPEFCR